MGRAWTAVLVAVWLGFTGCGDAAVEDVPRPAPTPEAMPPLEAPPVGTENPSTEEPSTQDPRDEPPARPLPPTAPDFSTEVWRFPGVREERACAPAHAGQVCSADCFCWEDGALLQGNSIRSVWVHAADDAWAAAGRALLHWDGTAWKRVPGVQGDFQGVWGAGPRDVWAVGYAGRALHWDGDTWTETDTGTTHNLYAVWGSGPGDVWAVGNTVLHWDGSRWSERPIDAHFGGLLITGTGPEDVWVGGTEGRIYQWDGKGWNARRPPVSWDAPITSLVAVAPGVIYATSTRRVLRSDGHSWWEVARFDMGVDGLALWGRHADDMWAVWGGRAAHWDGTAWTTHETPLREPIFSVAGSGAEDVWAVGARGGMMRWDGQRWAEVAAASEPRYPVALWARTAEDVWVVGYHGLVRRWDGQRWTRLPLDASLWFTSVWGSSADSVWLTGSRHLSVDREDLLMHWDGTALREVSPPGGMKVTHVWGTGPEDIWMVGSAVYHWDGKAWTARPFTDARHPPDITAIWGSGPDDVWVGLPSADNWPTLYHWDGESWTPFRGAGGTVRAGVASLWGSGPADVWALTNEGLLHWDGQAWRRLFTTYANQGPGYQVWGTGPEDVWVTGVFLGHENPRLLHWNGREWRPVDDGVSGGLQSLGGTPGQVWGLSREGVLRFRPAP